MNCHEALLAVRHCCHRGPAPCRRAALTLLHLLAGLTPPPSPSPAQHSAVGMPRPRLRPHNVEFPACPSTSLPKPTAHVAFGSEMQAALLLRTRMHMHAHAQDTGRAPKPRRDCAAISSTCACARACACMGWRQLAATHNEKMAGDTRWRVSGVESGTTCLALMWPSVVSAAVTLLVKEVSQQHMRS